MSAGRCEKGGFGGRGLWGKRRKSWACSVSSPGVRLGWLQLVCSVEIVPLEEGTEHQSLETVGLREDIAVPGWGHTELEMEMFPLTSEAC